jgi:hypothetical protein
MPLKATEVTQEYLDKLGEVSDSGKTKVFTFTGDKEEYNVVFKRDRTLSQLCSKLLKKLQADGKVEGYEAPVKGERGPNEPNPSGPIADPTNEKNWMTYLTSYETAETLSAAVDSIQKAFKAAVADRGTAIQQKATDDLKVLMKASGLSGAKLTALVKEVTEVA